MSKKTKDFTDAELSVYSKMHLLYEIRMLVNSAKLMSVHLTGADAEELIWAFQNSRVEAFAIHLRNLIDFICPRRYHDTDVIAADFLPDGAAFRPISKSLHSARQRADKEVGHLTTGRRQDTDPDKPWPVGVLLPEVFGVLTDFVNIASNAKLDGAVPDYVLQLAAQLRPQQQSVGAGTE